MAGSSARRICAANSRAQCRRSVERLLRTPRGVCRRQANGSRARWRIGYEREVNKVSYNFEVECASVFSLLTGLV